MASNHKLDSVNPVPSILVAIICAIISFFLWQSLDAFQKHDQQQRLHDHAVRLSADIRRDAKSKLTAFVRLTERWIASGGTPRREFESDAGNYIRDIEGLQAIEWVDETYHVRWVVPLEGNEKALNLNLGFEERRRVSLEKARATKEPTITKPINLVQGGKGFLVYLPIHFKEKFGGFVLVVMRTQDWLNHAVSYGREHHELEDLYISIDMDGERVFESAEQEKAKDSGLSTSFVKELYGHSFRVTIEPTGHFFSHGESHTALLVTSTFVVFSIIFICLIVFLQKSKIAKTAVERAYADLEIQSRERKKAEEEATKASEAKSRFLASMSHEIRTPLNAILGIVQILERRDLDDDTQSKLKTARNSGNFLLSLINQVLDFARIEAGAVETESEEFTVGSLVTDLHSLFLTQTEQKKIAFTCDFEGPSETWLVGCHSHLKQILFNLLGNAIKFTNTGAVSIVAKTVLLDEKNVELIFEVKDTGPGISDEEQKLVFEAFKQSESGRTSGLGTGLGLSISNNLCTLMGGNLTLESKPGVGSLFRLQVAVIKSENQNVQICSSDDELIANPISILVAEDNSINQMIIREILETDGHNCVLVDNGAEAVKEVQYNADQYDLVLMDIQMPVMNGVEATKVIKSLLNPSKELPIFALTANAFENQIQEYKEAGMIQTLTKPIDRGLLRRALLSVSGPLDDSHISEEAPEQQQRPLLLDKSIFLEEGVISSLMAIMKRAQIEEIVNSIKTRATEITPKLVDPNLPQSELRELAHEIKGVASNLGLIKLSSDAAVVEKTALDGEEIVISTDELCQTMMDSLECLSEYVDSHYAEKAKRKTG